MLNDPKRGDNIAQRMTELFGGHQNAHGIYGEPEREPGKMKWEIKKTARTVREPVTVELWERHLRGEIAIGIILIDENGNSRCGSIDFDSYDTDLIALVTRVESLGLPLVACRSKSGGLHLFLFLSEPRPAAEVIAALKGLAAKLGLDAKVEIFPKQAKLDSDRGDVGNWIAMPYATTFGGKLCDQVGVRKNGNEMLVDEFVELAEERRIGAEQLAELAKLTAKKKERPQQQAGPMPPCLAKALEAGVSDGRNETLMNLAIYFKSEVPSGWENEVGRVNHDHFNPPLTFDEVRRVVESVSKKDYDYLRGDTHPMGSMCLKCDCSKSECRLASRGSNSRPIIEKIFKHMSDPPTYTIQLTVGKVEGLSVKELKTYRLFSDLVTERLDVIYQGMKSNEWLTLISEHFPPEQVEADETGLDAMFKEMLPEFLTGYQVAERRQDLVTGRPWEDTEAGWSDRGPGYYFHLKEFAEFVSRNKSFNPAKPRQYIATQLNKIEGSWNGSLKVQGDHVMKVWFVPLAAIRKVPLTEAPKPKPELI